jgi:MFS family permease
MSSIFHASSVFGTLLAAAAGAFIVGNPAFGENGWRWGFAIGAAPALLTLWIRWKLREPDQWIKARERASEDSAVQPGRLLELFVGSNLRGTIVGVSLASIGLVTFWGIHIYGKDALLRKSQDRILASAQIAQDASQEEKNAILEQHKPETKRAEMWSMVLNTIGGGLGLVLFGTISNRMGRRGAFMLYHVMAFVMVLVLFKYLIPNGASETTLSLVLPIFGFFTLGMHAGYAVYFPELYPTRLRGTGAGFCFNMGRLATAGAFFLFAATPKPPIEKAMILAPLYLLGVVVVLFGKETRGQELPE